MQTSTIKDVLMDNGATPGCRLQLVADGSGTLRASVLHGNPSVYLSVS